MMQGSRDLHRRWWLSKRFSIFDAKYVSGTYKSDAVEIKCLNGTEAGQQFTITAGYPLDYGYGINNKPREKGVTLNIGDSYTFTTQEVVNVGDPIRIYGAPNISELDLSPMTNRLATLTVTNANSDTLGTKMKKLVVGNPNVANMELKEISGLKKLTSLEYLDIQGLKNITSLDLTSQPQLKELKAFGSNIASVSFAKGAPIEKLELPTSVTSLDLNHLTRLTTENLLFESGMNGISSISIKGCPKLSKDFAWVYNWYANKTTPNETSSLVMDNVDWRDVNAEQLAELTNLGHISLKGKVTVTDITLEQLNMLIEVFGESAFDKNAELFINAPDAIFVTGRTELLEGESEDYACIVFGAEVQSLSWSIYSGSAGSSYTTIDASTGLLTTKEGTGARTLVIRVVARTSAGTKSIDTSVSVKARTYPASGTTTLSGSNRLNNTREVYKLAVTTPNVNGEYVVTWSLSGMDGYAEIESSSNTQCTIKKLQEATTVVNGTLTATVKKKYNNYSLFSKTFAIELVNDTIAETDKGIVTALYNAGLCANSTYLLKEEAAIITDIDLQPGTSYGTSVFYSQKGNIKSFDGFKYFTSVTKVPKYLFGSDTYYGNWYTGFTSITIPSTVTVLEEKCFCSTSSLKHIKGGESVNEIGNYAFYNCYYIETFELPLFAYVKALPSPDSVVPNSFYASRYKLNSTYISGNTNYGKVGMAIVKDPISKLSVQDKFALKEEVTYDTPLGQATTIYLPDITYCATKIYTNMSEVTSFNISYTSTITGLVKEDTINTNEEVMLDLALGYKVTISAISQIDGYYCADYVNTPGIATNMPFSTTMTYKLITNLYIQHIDGTLYTQDEWTNGGHANDQANGVAVVTSKSSFVIAKTYVDSLSYGYYGTNVAGVVSTKKSDTAALDFKGVSNSEKLQNSPAVSYCKNLVFPNGKTGYLGAAGEWKIIADNKGIINTLLTLIGGDAFPSRAGGGYITPWFWTSTQYNDYSAWTLRTDSYSLQSSSKDSSTVSHYTRAFQSIGSLRIISNRSYAQFSVTYTNLWGVIKTDTIGVGVNALYIKQGTEVNIVPLSVFDGLEVEGKTFIYSIDQSEQTFNYAIGEGIYIQHIDGSLYTTDEWTSGEYTNDESNGVAVVVSDAFVIAKENISGGPKWGGSGTTVMGIVTSKSLSDALLDYDGEGNTQKIIEQLSGTGSVTAAEACANYTFPNGKKGYLPAYGEWNIAKNNKAAIDSVMALIGGVAISPKYYLSSTQYSDSFAWGLYWGSNGASGVSKTGGYPSRAFQSL